MAERETMRLLLITLLVGMPIIAAARPVRGAVFALANGGRIEGELLNPEENPRKTYVVRTDTGGVVTLTRAQVVGVLEKTPRTVEEHWEVAEKCREWGLKDQRRHHLREILKLDPDHEGARRALGYGRTKDGWVKTDEWMTKQGYIRYGGAWRIPQDVLLEEAAKKAEKRQNAWKRKVKTWREAIVKRRGKQQEAIDAIRAIDDPAAAPALVAVLEDKEAPRELRLLAVEVLGRLRSPVAVGAFVKRAMDEADANLRDACLDQLAKFGTHQAVRAFERMLRSKDNQVVNRAAVCLAALGQPEATRALIDALFTKHTFLVQQGGGPGQLNLGFGSGPGGGGNTFGVGGRPKAVTQTIRNQHVLDALVALNPGVNFGFDVEAWKQWYIEQHEPPPVTLRRDD